jgi:hypothetical protein
VAGDTDQLAAEAEPAAGEAGRAEEVPERVEEQRVEERLGELDVAEMARAVAGGLGAGLAAARAGAREFRGARGRKYIYLRVVLSIPSSSEKVVK